MTTIPGEMCSTRPSMCTMPIHLVVDRAGPAVVEVVGHPLVLPRSRQRNILSARIRAKEMPLPCNPRTEPLIPKWKVRWRPTSHWMGMLWVSIWWVCGTWIMREHGGMCSLKAWKWMSIPTGTDWQTKRNLFTKPMPLCRTPTGTAILTGKKSPWGVIP